MSLLQWLTWLGIALALAVNALAYHTYQATRHDLEAVRLRTFTLALERDLAQQRVQLLMQRCGTARWPW